MLHISSAYMVEDIMNINLELYKVFYEVANQKSISKGAMKLMISQPAVTQSIKTLEEQLGGKLFIRTPKGVVLTNEGKELFTYIKEGMTYFVNGTNKFTSLRNLEEGIINIGATTTISENFLMKYLKEFHNKYPNIDINITNDLTDNLIKNLRNGSLDIIITSIPNYEINDINYKMISTLNDIFVGSSSYKSKDFNSLVDVLKENILVQKSPSITRNNFNIFLKENNLECNPKMEVVSHNLLTKLAENNFGIAVLTKEFIKDKLGKSLYEIKTDIKIPKRKIGYAVKKNSIPSFTASKFIEILNK